MEGALSAFVDAVNATGGVYARSSGLHATVAGERPEDVGEPWIDLGEAYVLACAATGAAPLIDKRLSEQPEHGDHSD